MTSSSDAPANASVSGSASAWAAAAEDLHDVPVAAADRATVERWLSTWDRWTRLGHDYADAVEAHDDVEARALVDASEVQRAALARFAVVNSMAVCAP